MKLADILADSSRLNELTSADIPALRAELTAIDTVLLTKLLQAKEPSAAGDCLLDVAEASRRLGVSDHYLYRHAKDFPFTKRLGRKLLFSEQGIQRHLRR